MPAGQCTKSHCFRRTFLLFDDEQTFAREHEEVLLLGLAVIPAAALSGLEDADGVADLFEADLVAFEDERIAENGIGHPAPVADVHHEPARGRGSETACGLFEPCFFDHCGG